MFKCNCDFQFPEFTLIEAKSYRQISQKLISCFFIITKGIETFYSWNVCFQPIIVSIRNRSDIESVTRLFDVVKFLCCETVNITYNQH